MNWKLSNRPAWRCSFSPWWTRIKRLHSSSPKMCWCSDLAHSFRLAQSLSKVREGLWAPLLGSMQQDELCSASWRSKCWARVGESAHDLCWDCGWVKSLMSKAVFLPPFFVASRVPINELFEKTAWTCWTCPGSKTQLRGARNLSYHFWYRAWMLTLLQRLFAVCYEVPDPRVSNPNTRWDGRWVQVGRINLVSVGHTLPTCLVPTWLFLSLLTLVGLFPCPVLSK